MADAQILAIAITVLVVLAGTTLNNSRIGDVKEVLRAEIKNAALQLDNGLLVRFSAMENAISGRRFSAMEGRFNSVANSMNSSA